MKKFYEFIEPIVFGVSKAFYQIGNAILISLILIWVWTPDWIKWCIGKIIQFISWYASSKLTKTKFILIEYQPEDFFIAFQKDYGHKLLEKYIRKETLKAIQKHNFEKEQGQTEPEEDLNFGEKVLDEFDSIRKSKSKKKKTAKKKKAVKKKKSAPKKQRKPKQKNPSFKNVKTLEPTLKVKQPKEKIKKEPKPKKEKAPKKEKQSKKEQNLAEPLKIQNDEIPTMEPINPFENEHADN
ncbi:hypothetical protein [Leptospira phage LE4]|uniref:Uncharacterized protein n=1 Tax=Leptospira phage LE4 TaxID=2041383 RepID=A0A343LEB6_9CAUD|nr:hypothetical protein HWB34_gp13 [Leptospira phage LE4]ATN95026.1 hypothetical protein [Leptospira phage LE4]